jgi:uncharacterized membrane protein HdeD (DUF308 family)
MALARGAHLIIAGLVIALTPGHNAQFGLIVLGSMLLSMSALFGLIAVGLPRALAPRGMHLWQAFVSLIVGALALALNTAGALFLVWAIVFWSVLAGVAEVFAGIRSSPRNSSRRDLIVQGSLTVILGLIVVIQPPDSVAVVGFLGAWAIVQGVYLTIAGLSEKWATHEVLSERNR